MKNWGVCVLGKDSKSFDLDINTLQPYPLQVGCGTVYAPSISLVFRFYNFHHTSAQRVPSHPLTAFGHLRLYIESTLGR